MNHGEPHTEATVQPVEAETRARQAARFLAGAVLVAALLPGGTAHRGQPAGAVPLAVGSTITWSARSCWG